MLAGALILPGRGFTPPHGYPALSLASGPDLRAAAGSVLYLALIALLALGVATAVRDSAVSIGLVLALLYLFPVIASALNPHWSRHLEQIGPMSAGLTIQVTAGLRGLPLTPWQGLGVLALWAAGALIIGGLALRLRDALQPPRPNATRCPWVRYGDDSRGSAHRQGESPERQSARQTGSDTSPRARACTASVVSD
jgi:ABC-2 type transport system permease protein